MAVGSRSPRGSCVGVDRTRRRTYEERTQRSQAPARTAIAARDRTSPPPSTLPRHLLHHLHFTSGSLSSIRITPHFLAGVGMASTGALIRWLSYRALGRFFTFELTIKENHKLITSGPYAYVRHPGYSAILLCVTGVGLTFCGPVGVSPPS